MARLVVAATPLLLLGCSGISLKLEQATDAQQACADAVEGSQCMRSMAWLKAGGLEKHPTWYPMLSKDSTYREVQAVLNKLGKSGCPRPCDTQEASEDATAKSGVCRDAQDGDWCYKSMLWLRSKGLQEHPDWYPNLTSDAPLADFQLRLHQEGKADCPMPCASMPADQRAEAHNAMANHEEDEQAEAEDKEAAISKIVTDDCYDAKPDEQCFHAVAWAQRSGIVAHPEWYPSLTKDSNFEDFQEHLYLRGKANCKRPCSGSGARLALEREAEREKLTPKRRKLDPSEMTIEQLNRFLSGSWDGYVACFGSMDCHSKAQTVGEKRDEQTAQARPEAKLVNLAKVSLQDVVDEEPLPRIDQDAADVPSGA